MTEVEYVFVVNGIWQDMTTYDKVFVVNGWVVDLIPSEYKQVYVINGMHEDAKPSNYSNVYITNGYPDSAQNKRVYVVNFDALKNVDSVREKFFPNLITCPRCWHFFEVKRFVHSTEMLTCPKCWNTFPYALRKI